MTKHTVLLTGGTGFIGSHTAVQLCQAGYGVVLLDNLVNSKHAVVQRVQNITGQKIPFYKADVRDTQALQKVFDTHDIYAVVHFAALKSVGESVQYPQLYYQNNIGGLESLLAVMAQNGCYNMVFSSSATVYGTPESCPIGENHPLRATNPYGETKIVCEDILRATQAHHHAWRVALLRYFNPIGAHPSGELGEDPNGIPNNLAPYIAKVAIGALPEVRVFGNDYNTPDGTGVRDYIHIMDLADGHVCAVQQLKQCGVTAINLGTGKGYSVLQVIRAFADAWGKPIKHTIHPRRDGDIATCYADVAFARQHMGWVAQYDITEMAKHHLQWVQQQNKE